MHKKVKTSRIGRRGSFAEKFFEDLIILRKLSLEEQIKLIDKAFGWFPKKAVDSEWEEWTKGLPDTEKKEVIRALRVLYYMIQEGIKVRLVNQEFITDLRADGLSEEFISYFMRRLDDCDLSQQKLRYLGFFVFASLEEEFRTLSSPKELSHESIFKGDLAEKMGLSDIARICLRKYVALSFQLFGLDADEDTLTLFANYVIFYWVSTREIFHTLERGMD